jgi:hypothetical protein
MKKTIFNTEYTQTNFKNLISKDSYRDNLHGVYVNAEDKELIVTNSFSLVQFPLKEIDGDINRIISLDSFPTKLSKNEVSTVTLTESETITDIGYQRNTCKLVADKFPDYKAITPSVDMNQPISGIKIDIKLIADIYTSLKPLFGANIPTYFTFNGIDKAISFETDTDINGMTVKGLIMPMLYDRKDKK